jgi:hypothetical protein
MAVAVSAASAALDLPAALAGRDLAVRLVAEHADQDWKDKAAAAVRWLARERRTFTSDDVWEALARHYPDVTTHEARALGPVLTAAARAGTCRIQSCGQCGTRKVMVQSRRPQANGMDTPVYDSLTYAPTST